MLAFVAGYLVVNHKSVFWTFAGVVSFGAVSLCFKAYSDSGEAWTKAQYSEWLLEAAIPLFAAYVCAVMFVAGGKFKFGLRQISKLRMALALALVPAFFLVIFALALS